jgi:hypothetical protein
MKMVLIPALILCIAVASQLKNSLEGNELKQRTASYIKKFVTEIHP